VHLFDSVLDPYERVDPSEEQPEVVRRLMLRIQDHRRVAESRRVSSPVEAGAAMLKSLREVGYLGEE